MKVKICNPFSVIGKKLKDNQNKNELRDIFNDYMIKEYEGTLYILLGSVAVYKANADETIKDITQKIDEFRQISLDYKKLKQNENIKSPRSKLNSVGFLL